MPTDLAKTVPKSGPKPRTRLLAQKSRPFSRRFFFFDVRPGHQLRNRSQHILQDPEASENDQVRGTRGALVILEGNSGNRPASALLDLRQIETGHAPVITRAASARCGVDRWRGDIRSAGRKGVHNIYIEIE